jgi:hypothetical protein
MVNKFNYKPKNKKKTQKGGSGSKVLRSRTSRESRESSKPYLRKSSNKSEKQSFRGSNSDLTKLDKLKKTCYSIYEKIIKINDNIQNSLDSIDKSQQSRYSDRSSGSTRGISRGSSRYDNYISVIENIAEMHILYDDIKQKLDDFYETDKEYFKREFTVSGTLKDLYNQEEYILRLLYNLRPKFLVMKDAISFLSKVGFKSNIDLSNAFKKKSNTKLAEAETYKNFLDALIYLKYLTKKRYLDEITQKQKDKKLKIVLVDSENFLMASKESSREFKYNNLGRTINQYITKNRKEEEVIFILVNHGDIYKDKELFGQITDNIYYVNVKCKPHISCEADDFLLILLAIHFGLNDSDKYDVNLMTRDNYSWFRKKMHRGSLIYSDTGEIVYEYEPFPYQINNFASSLPT